MNNKGCDRGEAPSRNTALGRSAEELRRAQADAGGTVGNARQPRRVLVIEDDAIVLMGLKAILQSWGYDVVGAGSGAQALERVSTGWRPDMVMSDYRLKAGELGTDAVTALRQAMGMDLPGLILSGESSAECARAAEARGLELVQKPVSPRLLARAVDAALANCTPS